MAPPQRSARPGEPGSLLDIPRGLGGSDTGVQSVIVDSHVHLLPGRRAYKLIEWTLRFNPAHPIPLDVTLDALFEDFRQVGISRIWNFAHAIFPDETARLNDWNHQLAADHPKIVPIGTCHPETPDPVAVVDRCLGGLGFIGMKFHPFVQKFTPWDRRFFPVWERIAARGGLVIFHTGFQDFYDQPLPLGGFDAIADAFPDLVIVLGHANYPRVAEAFEFLARHPNAHVDTALFFGPHSASWGRTGADSPRAQLSDGIAALPDRVMFGSDHPSGPGTLAEMYRDFKTLGLAPDVEAKVAGQTALRLETEARKRLAAARVRGS